MQSTSTDWVYPDKSLSACPAGHPSPLSYRRPDYLPVPGGTSRAVFGRRQQDDDLRELSMEG